MGRPLRVKLSYPEYWYWPAELQTPGRTAVWNNCRFLINQPVKECDFWVVFEDLDYVEVTRCPPGHTLLITGEPPSVRAYSEKFVGQFSTAITCHPDLPCSEVLLRQQGLPWHVGRLQRGPHNIFWSRDYDELKSIKGVEKTRLISVISSDKAFTAGHQRRREFVARLKEHFGDRLDIFGRGVREVDDKWDALAPYKYHLALENFSCPHYWTEKLSDTFLAHAYPIYGGCPNVQEYFPRGSLAPIDMESPENAIDIIEECLKNRMWENSQEVRAEARELVLDRYNLFAVMADLIEQRMEAGSSDAVRVKIGPDVSWTHRLIRFLGRVKKRITPNGFL